MSPEKRGPSPAAIVAAAGGAALLLTVAVGSALRSPERETAIAPTAPAPAAPSAALPPPEAAPGPALDPPAAGSARAAVAFALRTAERLEASEQEGAAVAVLDQLLASEGEVPEVRAARERLLTRSRDLLATAQAEVRDLLRQERRLEARREVAVLRVRLPDTLHPLLDALAAKIGSAAPAAEAEASTAEVPAGQPPAEAPDLATYRLLARNLGADASPEAVFKLGEWARARGLEDEARACYERVVRLDAFHEGARLALGHKQHEGRWYTEEEYHRDVLGLVQDEQGRWVKPEADATTTAARPREKEAPAPATPDARLLPPPPPPAPYAEDKEWYQDNEAVCAWGDAPVYESKYYRIRTNVKPEYAKRYGKMMDQYFKRFVKVFKDFLPSRRYEKSELWIHSSREEFQAEHQVGPTTGGFYSPQTKRVVCYHGLFGQQGTTRDVLAHEGTHQFEDLVLVGKLWNAPIWIIEGLAVLFESAYYDDEKEEVRIGLIPRERLYSLKRGLATGSLIPLRTLLRTPQPSFTGYHYAHAWGLIYMVLFYADSPKVRRRCQQWFSDLFADALRMRVTPEHVEAKLGGVDRLKELEEQWHAWIRDLPYDYDPKER